MCLFIWWPGSGMVRVFEPYLWGMPSMILLPPFRSYLVKVSALPGSAKLKSEVLTHAGALQTSEAMLNERE